jgi:hypothetical protein
VIEAMQQVLDTEFKRIAAIQAELDHVKAKQPSAVSGATAAQVDPGFKEFSGLCFHLRPGFGTLTAHDARHQKTITQSAT